MRPFIDGAKAWVSDVNARGGVNGHPVRLILADDGGDPSAARSFANGMVERRGSFSAQAYAAGKLIEVVGKALGDE